MTERTATLRDDATIATRTMAPGRAWYWLAAIVFGAGILLAGYLAYQVRGIFSFTQDFARVVVPGNAVFDLNETGTYTIYHEYRTVVDGTVFSGEEGLPGMTCSMRASDTGQPVALSTTTTTSSYQIGSRAGTSVAKFDVDRPGAYDLSCRYAGGQEGARGVLAIGRGDFFSLIAWLGGAVGALLVSGGIALAIAIVTNKRRERAGQLIPSTWDRETAA